MIGNLILDNDIDGLNLGYMEPRRVIMAFLLNLTQKIIIMILIYLEMKFYY